MRAYLQGGGRRKGEESGGSVLAQVVGALNK